MGKATVVAANVDPQVIALAVPLSVIRNSNKSPSTGVPVKDDDILVIAWARAVIEATSVVSLLVAGVADWVTVTTRLVLLLLDNVSAPAKVESVPVVGRVIDVAAVVVNVSEKAPEVIKVFAKVTFLVAVKVKTSAPAKVIESVASVVESEIVRVLALVKVIVPVVVVTTKPFKEVARATPKVGVVSVAPATLTTLPVPLDDKAVTAEVPAPNKIPVRVAAPVPPWATVKGVVRPVKEVILELAPDVANPPMVLVLVICLEVPAAPSVVSLTSVK